MSARRQHRCQIPHARGPLGTFCWHHTWPRTLWGWFVALSEYSFRPPCTGPTGHSSIQSSPSMNSVRRIWWVTKWLALYSPRVSIWCACNWCWHRSNRICTCRCSWWIQIRILKSICRDIQLNATHQMAFLLISAPLSSDEMTLSVIDTKFRTSSRTFTLNSFESPWLISWTASIFNFGRRWTATLDRGHNLFLHDSARFPLKWLHSLHLTRARRLLRCDAFLTSIEEQATPTLWTRE